MKSIITKLIKHTNKGKYIDDLLMLSKQYLEGLGWDITRKESMPIDALRNPIPWFTYSAITFLDKRLSKNMSVFEYGSGNSTLWFSSRVASVTSIEHDQEWYEKMVDIFGGKNNIEYINISEQEKYTNEVKKYEKAFDIIIIDGRYRVDCSLNCLPALKDDGIIIFDNSNRDKYNQAYAFFIDSGYKRLYFNGLGPINTYPWCTSVFYKSNNCLGI